MRTQPWLSQLMQRVFHLKSLKSEAGGGDGVDGAVKEYEEAAFPAEILVCR